MTRTVIITYLVLLTLNFFSCKEAKQREKVSENTALTTHNKTLISLKGFSDKNEIIYRTDMADFVFSRNSVLQYCNSKEPSHNNNFIYKQVISYLNQHYKSSIIIYDTIGTKLVNERMVNLNSESETLVRIRNQESPFSNVAEALDWMLLDIITAGKFKVYEHGSNGIIDNVILDEVNESYYGSKDILTKEGKKIFSKMTWIQ